MTSEYTELITESDVNSRDCCTTSHSYPTRVAWITGIGLSAIARLNDDHFQLAIFPYSMGFCA